MFRIRKYFKPKLKEDYDELMKNIMKTWHECENRKDRNQLCEDFVDKV